MQMGSPVYLSPGEVALAEGRFFGDLAIDRAWEYWVIQAGCEGL
jgi:hypothetical protein